MGEEQEEEQEEDEEDVKEEGSGKEQRDKRVGDGKPSEGMFMPKSSVPQPGDDRERGCPSTDGECHAAPSRDGEGEVEAIASELHEHDDAVAALLACSDAQQ